MTATTVWRMMWVSGAMEPWTVEPDLNAQEADIERSEGEMEEMRGVRLQSLQSETGHATRVV
jgi:hypothetical protein